MKIDKDFIIVIILNVGFFVLVAYIMVYNVPDMAKPRMCWDYFNQLLREKGGPIGVSFLNHTLTDEDMEGDIIYWGIDILEQDRYAPKYNESKKLCVCVCDES